MRHTRVEVLGHGPIMGVDLAYETSTGWILRHLITDHEIHRSEHPRLVPPSQDSNSKGVPTVRDRSSKRPSRLATRLAEIAGRHQVKLPEGHGSKERPRDQRRIAPASEWSEQWEPLPVPTHGGAVRASTTSTTDGLAKTRSKKRSMAKRRSKVSGESGAEDCPTSSNRPWTDWF